MNIDRVPIAFVAVGDDEEHRRRRPRSSSTISKAIRAIPGWRASSCRLSIAEKGIASALVRTVEAAAKRIGYDRLYLFTESATSLYAGLGWQALEQCDYRGERYPGDG